MYIIDFILHVNVHLAELISQFGVFTYLILFAIIFAETGLVFTPFLPGDSLIFAAGMFAANGSFHISALLILLFAAAVIGDNTNYWIGRYFGKKIVDNKYIPIKQEHVNVTQEFYTKHGGKTVFLARFMPIVRTFAPFVAGIGKMKYKKFIFFSISGGLTWVCGFVLAGYFFGTIPIIRDNFSVVIMIIVAASFLPGIYKLIVGKLRKK